MSDKKTSSGRLLSIDVTRGYAMFYTMGVTGMFTALANGTQNPVIIEKMAKVMTHAAWNGLPYCDTIFPMFIFISGLTFPFSAAKRERSGSSRLDLYIMIAKRCLTLILLGFVYNGLLSNFDFAGMRYYSVLGRIGIAWSLAAVIYLNTKKAYTRAIWTGGILIAYWLALTLFSAPDMPGAGNFTMQGNITGYIDRTLFPGHLYNEYYDPEGLLSTFAAVSTALMGMLTGQFLLWKNKKFTQKKKCAYMLAAGVILIMIGKIWARILPLNKRLWTSSFNCVVCGMALFTFAVFYYIIDIRGIKWWTPPLTALGVNAIAAYFGWEVFGRFEFTSKYLFGGVASLFPASYTQFFTLLGGIIIEWAIIYFLYKKKVYIKI